MKLLLVLIGLLNVCEMACEASNASFRPCISNHNPHWRCGSGCLPSPSGLFLCWICTFSSHKVPTCTSSTPRQRHNQLKMISNECDGEISDDTTTQTKIIAGTKFRIPTSEHIKTISSHQIKHPLTPTQTFCISKKLCHHCHPQSFGFHPTAGSKLSSGLFRLSCPLLVQAIDDWEATGGVREMSDWILQNDSRINPENHFNWKQKGYQRANEMQKNIRHELVSTQDRYRLIEKLGEYNANKFMESGVAGIPSHETFDVKCIHAHVADHLCRVSTNTTTIGSSTLDTILYGEGGNIIGQRALLQLHEKGVQILGNEVCWQQCSGSEGWRYVARKNRRGLKSTRLRRKEMRDEVESDSRT